MRKILTIARREYQAMVATKAFLLGITLMPILMLGGLWIPRLLKGLERAEIRRIAIVDASNQLFEPLKLIAEHRNQSLSNSTATKPTKTAYDETAQPTTAEDRERNARRTMGMDEIHRFELEQVSAEGFNDESRLELSERIRNGQLYAFIEIPAEVLTSISTDAVAPPSRQLPEISYVSQDAALADAKRWAESSLNQLIRARRLTDAGVSPTILLEFERRAAVVGSGLYTRDEQGGISSEKKDDPLASLFLPMGLMMLMFMVLLMSAQPMLESVMEEKTLRITEVLLGSANARQLMTGKLLGNVGGSLTLFGLYGACGLIFAKWCGYWDRIPLQFLPWLVVYQTLAVLMFGSIFMAIAASVTQLREAQSLLLPVWMVMVLPMLIWFNVVREPNSMMATVLSFFPPSTPMMMTLRLATGAVIPLWQIVLSFLMLLGGTVFGVMVSARIYRIGILWQGKTPRLTEIVAWAIRKPS
jgi:ABC-type Na+ efflux pump permease subunit